MKPTFDKYALYEASVQSPETHIPWFVGVYQYLRRKYARKLREDFCGTFQLSTEWVKRNRKNSALCLDLDPEALDYGKKHHYSKLSREQKTRIELRRQDVRSVTSPKADLIIGCNFSFFIFRERKVLVEYLKCGLQSLGKDGVMILELAGGPGMTKTMKEQKTVHLSKKKKIVYQWDQKSFDPIHNHGIYSIHFQLPNGQKVKDVFEYDWRLWSIPEVRDAMMEAGFKKTVVYWETEHMGEGTGEFLPLEKGDNAFAWIAYAVGLK